jgi:predicted nucleotidyltransferase
MSNEEISNKIIPLLIQAGATRAGLFGSAARGQMTPKSDIDLLVDLPKTMSLLGFVNLKLQLEEALKRPVDLVEYAAIKPRLKERILKEEVRVYDQGSRRVS